MAQGPVLCIVWSQSGVLLDKDLLFPSHCAPLDPLSSDEKPSQLGQCWERLWPGCSNEGRQEVCFLARCLSSWWGESNSSAFELCYSRAKLSVEDLVPQGPREVALTPARAGDPARQAVGKGCFRCSKWSCTRLCRARCLVPTVCPAFCWWMVTGECLLEGLAPSMGSGMCSQIWAQQGFFACVNIRKQKPETGKYWRIPCPAQLFCFYLSTLIFVSWHKVETFGQCFG